MERKFMVIAISAVNPNQTSVLTNKGWERIKPIMGNAKIKALSSADACASRDAAQENTLNKDYHFSVVEIA